MNEVPHEIFSFGMWVRRRRKALDLTQAALAQRVSCAEVTIRKLETDVFRPSRDMAERLATCLDLPADEHPAFLQAARGERSVDRLPTPLQLSDPARPDPGSLPLPVAIPRDTVPAPAPLPAGSRMPLSRNPLFVGREQDLRQLDGALHVGSTAAIGQVEIAAATGLGGIGKTQLACEFVHCYGQFFLGGVFWLSFADPAAVPAEVAACGGADGMQLRPEFGTLPLDEQVKLVLAAWESPVPRLLVFDNCEDEALLEQWRPKHGGCRVLLTSRRHHWDAALGVQPLPLDVLSRLDSLALLRTFRPDLAAENATLQTIAEALGDLPLALHLAGSFLAKYRHAITLAQYLQRLRAPTILDDRSLRAAGLSPTKHVQHVARTFEQSYERLDPTEPTDARARTLLAHAACFAPGEPVPRWMLLQTLELSDGDTDDALLATDALTRLIDLGLLETDAGGNLRLHRLLVAFVRSVLVDRVAQEVVEVIMLRLAKRLSEARHPRPLITLQPHLRFIVETVQQRQDTGAAGLFSALGDHLGLLGTYPEARHYLERAVAIQERVLGPDHPETAGSLHILGKVLHSQGEYVAARRFLERAVAIQERVLGPDHPETAGSLHQLGKVLSSQGEYVAARPSLERAVAIREWVLGLDHPDTAWSLHNLGLVLHAHREYAEARHFLERAVAIQERALGLDHPDTAWVSHSLGLVLHTQGEYVEARRVLERTVVTQERVLGPEHPNTIRSLASLGRVLHLQGEYVEARRVLERAVAIQERVLGPDHPETAWCLASLGELLSVTGKPALARHHLEQALAIQQRLLGPDHPKTEQTRQGLAMLDASRTSVPGS